MPSTTTKWLTPPNIAESLGVDPAKVLVWINSGELEASDVATKRGGRPRWRVSPEALERFLENRKCSASSKPVRVQRRRAEVMNFY